jgi:hypothetical protein
MLRDGPKANGVKLKLPKPNATQTGKMGEMLAVEDCPGLTITCGEEVGALFRNNQGQYVFFPEAVAFENPEAMIKGNEELVRALYRGRLATVKSAASETAGAAKYSFNFRQ